MRVRKSESSLGGELIVGWHRIDDESLVEWVLKLAEFDAAQSWRVDGFGSCVSWLEIQCGMANSTARERVRVAAELVRRPVVREAFVARAVGFERVREITRLDGLNDGRDAKFLADWADVSIRSLAARVREWNYYNSKERKPGGLDDHYGMFRQRGLLDGLDQLVIEAPSDQIDRLFGVLDAYTNWLFHGGDPIVIRAAGDPVDNARCEQSEASDSEMPGSRSLRARRLDALFDLTEEVALVHKRQIDPQRAAIGVTVQYEALLADRGLADTDQGSVISAEAVRRLCCDGGMFRMVIRGASEFMDLGRETRDFTWAQRRAIRARHNHRCAIEGCNRRITEIHHLQWWSLDGATSIENGIPLCSFHHHLVHEGGWFISWDAEEGLTRLVGPDGQVIESRVASRTAA